MIQDLEIDTDVFYFLFAKHNFLDPTKIKLLSSALQYSTYYIKAGTNRYIAKIFDKNFSDINSAFYLEAHSKLNGADSFFCQVLLVDYYKSRVVVVFKYVEGKVLPSWNREQSFLVGRNLAKVHMQSNNFAPACYTETFIEKINALFKQVQPHLSKDFSFIAKEVHLYNDMQLNLPMGLIHGDPYDNNLIFKNNGSVVFFDSIFMSYDFFLFDICHVFKKYYFDKEQKTPLKSFLSFIRGYESIRKITEVEKEMMPIVLRARIVFSILYLFKSSLAITGEPDLFVDICYSNYLRLKSAMQIKKINI